MSCGRGAGKSAAAADIADTADTDTVTISVSVCELLLSLASAEIALSWAKPVRRRQLESTAALYRRIDDPASFPIRPSSAANRFITASTPRLTVADRQGVDRSISFPSDTATLLIWLDVLHS